MPTYEYRCVSCEHQFERFQRMSDDPVQECEICGSSVKRLLFPVAIHFKGSGFYSTDYARKNALGSAGGSSGNGGGSDKSASADGTGSKDEAKPAETKEGSSAESSSTVAAAAGKND